MSLHRCRYHRYPSLAWYRPSATLPCSLMSTDGWDSTGQLPPTSTQIYLFYCLWIDRSTVRLLIADRTHLKAETKGTRPGGGTGTNCRHLRPRLHVCGIKVEVSNCSQLEELCKSRSRWRRLQHIFSLLQQLLQHIFSALGDVEG